MGEITKRYEPTEEDIQSAEESMDEEQAMLSDIRKENWQQEDSPWSLHFSLDDQNRRQKPSAAEVYTINKDLERLSDIFSGTGIKWLLDGAINISALKGEFIGIHGDIDISLEEKELQKAEGELLDRGYGFFVFTPGKEEGDKSIMTRVSMNGFRGWDRGQYFVLAAIDKKGKIIKDKEDLSFIDVHVIHRNNDGHVLTNHGVPLPDEWFEPIIMTNKDGNKIFNISHPARVAYYKLCSRRNYDWTDLEILAESGYLSKGDLDQLENIANQNYDNELRRGESALADVASRMTPGISPDGVMEIFRGIPKRASNINEKNIGLHKKLAEIFSASEDQTAVGLMRAVLRYEGIVKQRDEILQEINQLKKIVENVPQKRIVKNKISA